MPRGSQAHFLTVKTSMARLCPATTPPGRQALLALSPGHEEGQR